MKWIFLAVFAFLADLFCIFASRKQNIVKGMKKKNSMQMMLASMALMLMASPAFAQKFKVEKVERTRILIDRKWDAQPDAEAAKFIALISTRWTASWVLLWDP